MDRCYDAPSFSKKNEHIARGYFGLKVMEAAVFKSIELALLGLLTLSTNYIEVGSTSSASYDLIGSMLLALHGYDVTFLYIPSGLNELFLGVWLIAVGYRKPSKVRI